MMDDWFEEEAARQRALAEAEDKDPAVQKKRAERRAILDAMPDVPEDDEEEEDDDA